MVVIQVMVKLGLIILLGVILNKTGVLDTRTNKKISTLIVNLTSPLLVIYSVSTVEGEGGADILILVGIGFAMYVGLIVLAKLLSLLFHFPKADSGTLQCMLIFSNNSFMGYPVVISIFGEFAVFYCAMLHFSFQLFIYTYGVACLKKEDDKESGIRFKQFLSPGLMIVVAALLIYLFHIKLPPVMIETAQMVGNVTSPLSLLVMGSTLAMYSIKDAIKDWRCYAMSALRLLVVPLLTYAVCRLAHVNELMTGIAVITNAMPVASMVVMMSTQYDGNKELASRGVLISTVLSLITIPVLVSVLL